MHEFFSISHAGSYKCDPQYISIPFLDVMPSIRLNPSRTTSRKSSPFKIHERVCVWQLPDGLTSFCLFLSGGWRKRGQGRLAYGNCLCYQSSRLLRAHEQKEWRSWCSLLCANVNFVCWLFFFLYHALWVGLPQFS